MQFDAGSLKDGIGAQVHRKISVYVGASNLNCGFIEKPFVYFEPHPLQFEESSEKQKLILNQINELFSCESSVIPSTKSIKYSKVNYQNGLLEILKFKLFALFNNKITILCVHDLHSILDLYPNWYIKDYSWFNLLRSKLFLDSFKDSVCIHYRQSLGNMFIHPGQNLPRQIDFDRVVQVLSSRVLELKKYNPEIFILTDAPIQDTVVSIPSFEKQGFFQTFGLTQNEILIPSFDFSTYLEPTGLKFEVIDEKDPINLLKILCSSSVIIGSKSSFSFVSSVINKNAKVFMPREFWHNSPKSWYKF